LVVGALSLAGCSAGQSTPTTTSTTTTATTGPVPVLGRPPPPPGNGFGKIRPSVVYNGGDPTGLVTHIAWKSWGGSQAVGTGIGWYVAPNQDVASGTDERATVVAFDPGTCHGKYMYQELEWYFPQHGQTFDPKQSENICAGPFAGG
jgi:hypothetical protein